MIKVYDRRNTSSAHYYKAHYQKRVTQVLDHLRGETLAKEYKENLKKELGNSDC